MGDPGRIYTLLAPCPSEDLAVIRRPPDDRRPPTQSARQAMKRVLLALILAAPLGLAVQAAAEPLGVAWHAGAADCAAASWSPLQVHAYGPDTWILRQNPCAHPEANVLYLLAGTARALLIDTGAVDDAAAMPLARTVLDLLPEQHGTRLPLLVVHSHGHRDHRAGDVQFAGRPGVGIVPAEPAGMRAFFGFEHWPEGVATVDLGGRVVDVLPAPGHHPDHLVFHDAATGLLFTGDFLMPGRLLVDDLGDYRRSAARLVEFIGERPVTHVLGGHVELDLAGQAYPAGARHHPDERPLELAKDDLLALPAALEAFHGFYARHPHFHVSDPLHNLLALAAAVAVILAAAAWGLVRWVRRRRARAAGV